MSGCIAFDVLWVGSFLLECLELNCTASEPERLGDLVSKAQLRFVKSIGRLDFNERDSLRFNDGEIRPTGAVVVGFLHKYCGNLREEVGFHCSGKGEDKVLPDAWVCFLDKGVGANLYDVLI